MILVFCRCQVTIHCLSHEVAINVWQTGFPERQKTRIGVKEETVGRVEAMKQWENSEWLTFYCVLTVVPLGYAKATIDLEDEWCNQWSNYLEWRFSRNRVYTDTYCEFIKWGESDSPRLSAKNKLERALLRGSNATNLPVKPALFLPPTMLNSLSQTRA